MNDERVERRPLLRGKNLCNCLRIKRIRRQAVDGLSGKGDDFTGPQQSAGLGDGVLHFVIGNLENSGLKHARVLPEHPASGESSIIKIFGSFPHPRPPAAKAGDFLRSFNRPRLCDEAGNFLATFQQYLADPQRPRDL